LLNGLPGGVAAQLEGSRPGAAAPVALAAAPGCGCWPSAAPAAGPAAPRLRLCRRHPQFTSDITNVNHDQDEIDIEFLNSYPASKPTGFWPNSYINGKLNGPERISAHIDATSAYRWPPQP
jgi:hypothetical protein